MLRLLLLILICGYIPYLGAKNITYNVSIVYEGNTTGIGRDINNFGHIVGHIVRDGVNVPFIYNKENGIKYIEIPDTYKHGSAVSINDNGEVAGSIINNSDDSKGFYWSKEKGLIIINGFNKDNQIDAVVNDRVEINEIGNNGDVVGKDQYIYNSIPGNPSTFVRSIHGFSWNHTSGITNIGTLLAIDETKSEEYRNILDHNYVSFAYGVNDIGSVVGSSHYDPGSNLVRRCYLWNKKISLLPIGNDNDKGDYHCFKINNSGQVIGKTSSSTFIWSNKNGLHILGEKIDNSHDYIGLRLVKDINDSGQVIGVGEINAANSSSIWDAQDGVRKLTNLINPNDFFYGKVNISGVQSINNSGQIIGTLRSNGSDSSINCIHTSCIVLLTPVEESDIEVKLSEVKITQAVFDEHEPIDLVANRETAILSKIELLSGTSNSPIDVEAQLTDMAGNVVSEISKIQVKLSAEETTEIPPIVFSIPEIEGKFQVSLEIDPNNEIIEDESSNNKIETDITVHRTKNLNLQYAYIKPRICNSSSPPIYLDCLTTVNDPSVSNTIKNANSLLQKTYPVPDNGINNVSPVFEQQGSMFRSIPVPFTDKFFFNLMREDLVGLYRYNKKYHLNAKRIIGIVADGYYKYHRRKPGTKGFAEPSSYPYAALSSLDNPPSIAHELGHLFGLGEGYLINGNILTNKGEVVTGYDPSSQKEVRRQEFMGISEPTNPVWVSGDNWHSLTSSLNYSGKDPELLIIGFIIGKDNSINHLPWIVADGTIDYIPPGDYAVVLKNINGEELFRVPFGVNFKIYEEPFGKKDVDDSLVGFSIPYSSGTASVEIVSPIGEIIAVIDPVIKTFKDALNSIPDQCFINDPIAGRENISNLLIKMEGFLINLDVSLAKSLMQGELLDLLETKLIQQCFDQPSLDTSKEDFIVLIDKTLPHLEARIALLDQDNDGILDDYDICPDSNIDSTITIGTCSSGVKNTIMDNGCSVMDKILDCRDIGKNHGQFVQCTGKITNRLKQERYINGSEKGAIQRCVAQSNFVDL